MGKKDQTRGETKEDIQQCFLPIFLLFGLNAQNRTLPMQHRSYYPYWNPYPPVYQRNRVPGNQFYYRPF